MLIHKLCTISFTSPDIVIQVQEKHDRNFSGTKTSRRVKLLMEHFENKTPMFFYARGNSVQNEFHEF